MASHGQKARRSRPIFQNFGLVAYRRETFQRLDDLLVPVTSLMAESCHERAPDDVCQERAIDGSGGEPSDSEIEHRAIPAHGP